MSATAGPAASAVPRCARSPRASARLITVRAASAVSARDAAYSRRASLLKTDPVMAGLIAAAGPLRSRTAARSAAVRSAGARHRAPATAWRRRRAHPGALCRAVGSGGFPSPQQVSMPSRRAPARRRLFVRQDRRAQGPGRQDHRRHGADSAPSSTRCRIMEIIERLTEVRGIGRWTVEMMLMFQLQRPDVLPVDDFGVRNGFRLAYGLRGMPTAARAGAIRRALEALSQPGGLVPVARQRSGAPQAAAARRPTAAHRAAAGAEESARKKRRGKTRKRPAAKE